MRTGKIQAFTLAFAGKPLILDGARSRNRTGTPLRAGDFKSHASTSFAIRAVARSRGTGTVNRHQASQCLKQGVEYIHPVLVKQGRSRQKNLYLHSEPCVKTHSKSGAYGGGLIILDRVTKHRIDLLNGAKTNTENLSNQLIYKDLLPAISSFKRDANQTMRCVQREAALGRSQASAKKFNDSLSLNGSSWGAANSVSR